MRRGTERCGLVGQGGRGEFRYGVSGWCGFWLGGLGAVRSGMECLVRASFGPARRGLL